jgi:hypothetical protein
MNENSNFQTFNRIDDETRILDLRIAPTEALGNITACANGVCTSPKQ